MRCFACLEGLIISSHCCVGMLCVDMTECSATTVATTYNTRPCRVSSHESISYKKKMNRSAAYIVLYTCKLVDREQVRSLHRIVYMQTT